MMSYQREIERFDPEVVLFHGSLAKGTFRLGSDVDIPKSSPFRSVRRKFRRFERGWIRVVG